LWQPLDLRLVFACFAAISEALNSSRFFKVLSTLKVSYFLRFAAVFTGKVDCFSFPAEPRIIYQFLITSQLRVSSCSTLSPLSRRFQQSLEFYTGIFVPVKKFKIFCSLPVQHFAPRASVVLSSAEPTIMARLSGAAQPSLKFLQ
jgi:hypothetical protein